MHAAHAALLASARNAEHPFDANADDTHAAENACNCAEVHAPCHADVAE
jgi:hypothetical protein